MDPNPHLADWGYFYKIIFPSTYKSTNQQIAISIIMQIILI